MSCWKAMRTAMNTNNGCGDRGEGASDDETEQGAEGEREQRVADGHDAALAEVGGADAVADRVDRCRPPGERSSEQHRRSRRTPRR